MLTYHERYLVSAGYESIEEYCDYIEMHPDSMDGLAVMLTLMLNHIHACIYHKNGQWHSHVKMRPCACSLHLASMGDNTFVCLDHLPHKSKKGKSDSATSLNQPAVQQPAATAAAVIPPTAGKPEVKEMLEKLNPETVKAPMIPKPLEDVMHWVHCKPYEYPTCTVSSSRTGFSAVQLNNKHHQQEVEKLDVNISHKLQSPKKKSELCNWEESEC